MVQFLYHIQPPRILILVLDATEGVLLTLKLLHTLHLYLIHVHMIQFLYCIQLHAYMYEIVTSSLHHSTNFPQFSSTRTTTNPIPPPFNDPIMSYYYTTIYYIHYSSLNFSSLLQSPHTLHHMHQHLIS